MRWLIFLLALTGSVMVKADDLETIRKNYELAVTDKGICQKMIKELGSKVEDHVNLAYLGAFQAIWANHLFNPVSKLMSFNKGKENIEKAVQKAPGNVEIRLIRLSIQKKSPAFLGYQRNIDEDQRYIKTNQQSISSPVLLKMVTALLNS